MLNNQISCTFEHHFLRNLEVTFTKPRVLFDKFTATLYFDFCPPHFKLVETTYDNLFNKFKDFSTHFFKIGICRVGKSLHLKVSVLDNLCKFVCNTKLVNNCEETGDIKFCKNTPCNDH